MNLMSPKSNLGVVRGHPGKGFVAAPEVSPKGSIRLGYFLERYTLLVYIYIGIRIKA